jgi:hypothetical protein
VLCNKECLAFLRLVRYRQIPWHKRTLALDTLRAHGLVGIRRVPPRVNALMPEAVDIAVLTGEGQEELERLERMALLPAWRRTGLLAYQAHPKAEQPRCS